MIVDFLAKANKPKKKKLLFSHLMKKSKLTKTFFKTLCHLVFAYFSNCNFTMPHLQPPQIAVF